MPAPRSERTDFQGAFGERLAARLEFPQGPPTAFVLFAHCFTCSKDLKATRRISRALAQRGFGVLRFDFTGLGESEGDFAETNFSSNLEDLVAAADFLREKHEAPQILIGHSLGGTAVLAAASRIPEARAVATIASPSDTDHLRDMLVERAPELEQQDTAEIELAGRKFTIRRQLLEDLAEQSLEEAIGNLGRPLLIFHSPHDRVVGIEHARRIFEAAMHPKSFVSLDDADHLLLQHESDARFVAEVLAGWAERYLDTESADEEPDSSEPGEVIVTGGHQGLRQEIVAGRHRLVGDEPEDHGGDDAGPNPYEFLLASLGTCTAMTVQMYAGRKDWPLHRVRVRLRHEKIHAKDCEDCETDEGKIDRLERVLHFDGDLSDEQRQRLAEIADRCPVSRTLAGEIKVVTKQE